MLKRVTMFVVSAIALIAILGVTACKLPSADEMRQPDYAGKTAEQVADEVIADIEQLFEEIRDGTEAGDASGEITQEFTESQLTALITQKIGSGDSAISNVLINIDPEDKILMASDLVSEGNTKEVVAQFDLEANGDTVALTLLDFTWGGLPAGSVPAARDKFEEQLNSGLQSAMDDDSVTMGAIPVPEGATVDEIVLGEGVMTITGTVTAEVLTE